MGREEGTNQSPVWSGVAGVSEAVECGRGLDSPRAASTGGLRRSARRRGDGGPGWSPPLPSRAPRAPRASPPAQPRRASPCSSSPARSGWGAGASRAGGALLGPGARRALGAWEPRRGAARPGEEGAEVSELGESPVVAECGVAVLRAPGAASFLRDSAGAQLPGGRGAEGRPSQPIPPPPPPCVVPLVLPEPRGSPQVGPCRKEARRDLVPGRTCPKGKGPAGYFYQSLWIDAALFSVRKRCLANR